MTCKVLLLGAYGNFGKHITAKLSVEANIQLILAGRSESKCQKLAKQHAAIVNPPQVAVFDVNKSLQQYLTKLKPDVVIHTCGPFQAQNYTVAELCIVNGCHYIDLADGRDFVDNIKSLDAKAVAANVAIISGASSVPCLTAAVLDKYLPEFSKLEYVDSGIATAQRINVGLATIRGTLSYCGKPIKMLKDGVMQKVFGWQSMVRRKYPRLGLRYLAYCDVPDLALFPKRYPDLKSCEFRVSLEVTIVQWMMWLLSWLVRCKLIRNLPAWGPALRQCASMVDFMGSNDSGFHVQMRGVDAAGATKQLTFYLIAVDRFGPYIPSTPAIICAKKIANGMLNKSGAYPCLDIISLDEYLAELGSEKVFTKLQQDS